QVYRGGGLAHSALARTHGDDVADPGVRGEAGLDGVCGNPRAQLELLQPKSRGGQPGFCKLLHLAFPCGREWKSGGAMDLESIRRLADIPAHRRRRQPPVAGGIVKRTKGFGDRLGGTHKANHSSGKVNVATDAHVIKTVLRSRTGHIVASFRIPWRMERADIKTRTRPLGDSQE